MYNLSAIERGITSGWAGGTLPGDQVRAPHRINPPVQALRQCGGIPAGPFFIASTIRGWVITRQLFSLSTFGREACPSSFQVAQSLEKPGCIKVRPVVIIGVVSA